MASLYIHIPFCEQKCFYCDFVSHMPQKEEYELYTKALCAEIALRQKNLLGSSVETIYFGGGTPSLLPTSCFEAIFQALRENFAIAPGAEITIEANPNTASAPKIAALKDLGANRLSLGVQAMQDKILKKIGRCHTSAQALEAIETAKKGNLSNISADLIYGLPGQKISDLAESIELLQGKVTHISIYGLTIEPKTVFCQQMKKGILSLPDEDEVEKMYDYLTEKLPLLGYRRYEISNFSHPGFESRHNLSYWQDKPYLGLGAAAHSYLNRRRFYNDTNTANYIKSCLNGHLAEKNEENVDLKTWQEEFCFLALRTAQGIDKERFCQNFGQPLEKAYAFVLPRLLTTGLVAQSPTHLFLTPKGMKFGNQVFAEFLI